MSKTLSGKEVKSKRRFSEEIEKEICKLYLEEEKSMYVLGKQFNCQRTLIDDILIRYKINKRNNNYAGHSNNRNIFSNKQEIEICNQYNSGLISRTELALNFKCGKTTIRNILLKHNIKL